LEELVREWREEFRELRGRGAGWGLIERQEPRAGLALVVFVETGDRYLAARLAGLTLGSSTS